MQTPTTTHPISPAPFAGSPDPKAARDIRALALFTGIYCRSKHAGRPRERTAGRGVLAPYLAPLQADLCPDCAHTLLHGAAKRVLCPYDPKPRCKHCPTPCYAPGHREAVRAIMRFSGLRLIARGRLDLLVKYLF